MSKWSFIGHLTDALQMPRLGENKLPTLWPSEGSAIIKNEHNEDIIVGKCRRAAFFRYLIECYNFYPKYSFWRPLAESLHRNKIPPTPYLLWLWKMGEMYEDYCIAMAKDSGVYIASQVPLYVKSHNISGKQDIIVINPQTHKYSTIETKSVYGFNAGSVIGRSLRDKYIPGVPRDSNLIQIALYDWHFSSPNEDFEESRLDYGARDTGGKAEYIITTELDPETEITHIKYKQIDPQECAEKTSPITINSILNQYTYIQSALDTGEIPPRDFDLQFSEDKIQLMYERGELAKGDTERHEKWLDFKQGKRARNVKAVQKGDWQCRYCNWANVCYDSKDSSPKEL